MRWSFLRPQGSKQNKHRFTQDMQTPCTREIPCRSPEPCRCPDPCCRKQVAIKFFPGESQGRHAHEKVFFDNRKALEPEGLSEHVEDFVTSFAAHRSVLTEESVPPALVYERGAYTLHVSPL